MQGLMLLPSSSLQVPNPLIPIHSKSPPLLIPDHEIPHIDRTLTDFRLNHIQGQPSGELAGKASGSAAGLTWSGNVEKLFFPGDAHGVWEQPMCSKVRGYKGDCNFAF